MEENSKNKISVIIPLYNKEIYIEKCLKSVLNQQFLDMEILVVNDGSTDNSIEIIKKYIKEDKRIKLINKKNGGLSSARNEGIKYAQSEYVMFVDADDTLEDNAINTIYSKAVEDNLDVVVFDINIINEGGVNRIWREEIIKEHEVISGSEYIIKYLHNKGIQSVCNKLWRRRLYIDNNIRHPEEISYGEDGSTTPRLIFMAKRIGKIDKAFYQYRINKNSLMGSDNIKVYEYIKAFNIAFDYLEKEGLKCSPALKFTYKFIYAYNYIEKTTIFNKRIRENDQYKMIYQEFYTDLKDRNNKIIDIDNSKALLYKRKMITESYRINMYLGELTKLVLKYISVMIKYILNKN